MGDVFEFAISCHPFNPQIRDLLRLAAWGIIALLIAVFPANIHVYQHQELFPLPWFVHLLRLPLQGVLILWAFAYTRR
jgi:uncharacterized membrane protein